MSAARRSLLTATAAGTLLGALWFVPSANATPEKPVQPGPAPTAGRGGGGGGAGGGGGRARARGAPTGGRSATRRES
ncbi:hypothetical protein ACFW9X_31375, partial [Streptomyces sp. NPDC059466]